ncbi:hypothetical protein [Ferribacterium limneticum]|uniref:hypothetical protein n=1 Tax=Ferribacterium limneticum TaxID=76259 RepID=UPI001CF82F83|nr:hypothetical protein [Ferribacterium limneticum]UCV23682.1 hypothetical protein KI613_03845 [Ferribacterium limneticum]
MNLSMAREPYEFDPFLMRVCLWTGLALVAMTAVGFGCFMGYVPPPAAAMSADDLLLYVREHKTSILIGAALCTFFWSFWVTWAAPLIIYIRRMERAPLLTFASIANVGGGAAVITTIAVSWTVMAYRVEDAAIVQAFNDLGFFLFLYTWPPFAIWMFIIAIAILRDINPEQTFPRWVAFYNLWAGVLMAPASFMGFFKTGPFAYDGLLAFWLVAVDFFLWMVVMSIVMFRVVARDEQRMAIPIVSYDSTLHQF